LQTFRAKPVKTKSIDSEAHKKCGLLIFPGRLPQAPSRRQSAAPLLLLFLLRHKRYSVPPKELKRSL
jgi:hypothetical protein